MEKSIEERVENVRGRICAAAKRAGRDASEVKLLAATKNRSPAEVLRAIEAGIKIAGENRVQEFLSKKAEVGRGIEWHFIGHLQSNKAKKVVGVVEVIHSVDSQSLLSEVARRAEQSGVKQKVILQVNVAVEESKFGLSPGEVGTVVERAQGMQGIELCGLSTIAPAVDDPEQARWVFRELQELGVLLEGRLDDFRCRELSMGMTNDFEVAVEEGSTMVRIGSAIFGPISREGKAE